MSTLYAMSYWVDFPASEYGGLVIVRLKSKEGVHGLIHEHITGWDCTDMCIDDAVSTMRAIGYSDGPDEIVEMFVT